MDTLILHRPQTEKTATSIAGIGIALCLLFAQNVGLFAKDIGGTTGISPGLNYIKNKQIEQEEIFNKEIKLKYKNAYVIEVDKGVKLVKMTKYYNNRPVRINIVEVSQDANQELIIEPAIASTTLAARTKISKIANRENAIVAINGGYFKPETGTPLGTLMINKKIYTGPIYDRVAIGFFDDGYDMARIKLDAEIKTNMGGLKIDNVNQPRMLSTHTIVYTREWGTYSPQIPKYGMQIVVDNGKLVKTSYTPCEIPENGYVIVGPESKLKPFLNAKKYQLDVRLNPGWTGVNHIISGGPFLVRNGEVFVDMTDEKLTAIGGRNPRTAIGYTRNNNLILLTADGREGSSIGLTLNELANLMKQLGCVNAMNLDGGGSTVMYVNGQVVNKPATQGGIPLSHTLVIRKDYRISKL